MNQPRILYSFPHRIGAQRICLIAWQQVDKAVLAGAEATVISGSVARGVREGVRMIRTQELGGFRVPIRVLGRERSLHWHDWGTARWLDRHAKDIDIVHVWPGAGLRTIRVAREHGITSVMERPNAHTEYAFEASAREEKHCGIVLSKGHDHAFDRRRLDHELKEYDESDYLHCPSEFVARTF